MVPGFSQSRSQSSRYCLVQCGRALVPLDKGNVDSGNEIGSELRPDLTVGNFRQSVHVRRRSKHKKVKHDMSLNMRKGWSAEEINPKEQEVTEDLVSCFSSNSLHVNMT